MYIYCYIDWGFYVLQITFAKFNVHIQTREKVVKVSHFITHSKILESL
jgi:hypothetical protein